MNTRDDLDRRLSAWFAADAAGEPEQLLGMVLARTARTRRRPAWLIPERWISMTALSSPVAPSPRVPWRVLGAVALLILALLAVALYVGSQQRRLPAPFGLADNGQVAYVSQGQLFIADTNGRNPRAVTSDATVKGRPTWSRDGTRLAFLAYPDPDSVEVATLMVMNADGSNAIPLARDQEVMQFFSWSPDGKTIAFSSWITFPGQRDRVFLVPSDGSGAPVHIGEDDSSAFNPAFSPDGRLLAYQSDLSTYPTSGNLGYALKVMNADGTGIRVLVQRQGFIGNGWEGRAWGMEWSPVGPHRILLVTSEGDGSTATTSMSIVNVDDGTSLPIADSEGSEYGPAWSPDGTRIAFLRRDASGAESVVVLHQDGSNARVLATDVAGFTPQWSPDGQFIAVVDEPSSTGGSIRVLPVDGGDEVLIPFQLGGPDSASVPGIDAIGWQRVAK
jgi:Tol biopolymer transport system component